MSGWVMMADHMVDIWTYMDHDRQFENQSKPRDMDQLVKTEDKLNWG